MIPVGFPLVIMQQEEDKAIYNKRVGEIITMRMDIAVNSGAGMMNEQGFEDGLGFGPEKRKVDVGSYCVENERLIDLNAVKEGELSLCDQLGSNTSQGMMDLDLNLSLSIGSPSSPASLLSTAANKGKFTPYLHNKRPNVCSLTLDCCSHIKGKRSRVSRMFDNCGSDNHLDSINLSKNDEGFDKISVQDEDMVQIDLPNDLLYLVFSFLDQVDISRASAVCRQWRAAGSHEDFWKKFNFDNKRITSQQFEDMCRRYPNVVSVNLCDTSGLHLLPVKAISLLRNLEALSLGKMMIPETFFEALTGFSKLKNLILTDVNLGNNILVIDHERLCVLQIEKCWGFKVYIRCPQLEILSLKRSGMSKVVLNCPALRSLDIASCHNLSDSTIRSAVTSCPLLESLDMAKCSRVSDQTLSAIGLTCVNLLILDASYCSNIYFQSVSLQMLTVLKLHGAKLITSTAIEAISFSSLEILELDDCNWLTSVTLDLPRLRNIRLAHCPKLVDINLQCSMLSSITVSDCPLLGGINISSNTLRTLVLQKQEKLSRLTLECPSLQEVDLTECEILPDSICDVFSEGGGCPNVKSLILDLCESLTDVSLCSSSLVVLSLNCCRAIKSLAVKCPLLEQVSLDECEHIKKAIFLQVGLKSLNLGIFPKLNVLHIEASQLASLELKGCGALSEASFDCPNLISFDASFCSRLKDGCLSETISSCPLIESLILMSCSIGSNDLLALQWLPSLTYLDLSYTFLVDMEPIFKSCIHLKVLKLQACKQLVDWSLKPLYKEGALPGLRELDLSYGTLSHLAMEELLACCRRLTHVSLNGCVNVHNLNWDYFKMDQLTSAQSPSDMAYVDEIMLSNEQPTRMLRRLNCVGCLNIERVMIPCEAECLHLSSFNLSLSLNLKEVDVVCSNLAVLNLSNCCSLEILKLKCPKLSTLFLQSCNIGEEAIKDAISSCSMLETLDVRFCSKIYTKSMGKLRVACPSLKRIFNSLLRFQ